jgi:hypothetical protein
MFVASEQENKHAQEHRRVDEHPHRLTEVKREANEGTKSEEKKTVESIHAPREVTSHAPTKSFVPSIAKPSAPPAVQSKTSLPTKDIKESGEHTYVSTVPERTTRPVLSEKELTSRARTEVARDDRRTIILALLKQKPSVNVGDIAKSIPNVSEKTIQRELIAMVGEGVLLKKGERRWSTYSIRS